MGTYDITIYTATCDVGNCEATFGDDWDYSDGWSEFSSNCEAEALTGGWTKNAEGWLICKSDDAEHQEARGLEPDLRPKPGPGQLALALT